MPKICLKGLHARATQIVLCVLLTTASLAAEEGATHSIRLTATNPASDSEISLTINEVQAGEDPSAAQEFVEAAIDEAHEAGIPIFGVGVGNELPPFANQMLSRIEHCDGLTFTGDTTVLDPSQEEAKKHYQKMNAVYVVARVAGVAGGVGLVVSMTYGVGFLEALVVGMQSAIYPGINQAFPNFRQRMIMGKKDKPNSKKEFFARLAVSSAIFLGLIRVFCVVNGYESVESMTTLDKIESFLIAVGSSTALEFCWQRYFALLKHKRDLEDNQNWVHLEQHVKAMAALSVVSSIATAFSNAGWTLGTMAVILVASHGAVKLLKEFPSPSGLEETLRRNFRRISSCLMQMVMGGKNG